MNGLVIKGNSFHVNGVCYELDDMYTAEIYSFCENNNINLDNGLPIVNEVFLNRFLPYKTIEKFLIEYRIDTVTLKHANHELIPYLYDLTKKHKIKLKSDYIYFTGFKFISTNFNVLLSFLYLILKMVIIPFKHSNPYKGKNISLIRTPAAKKKMLAVDGIEIQYEDIKSKDSIYSFFSKKERVLWVIKSFIKSFKALGEYRNYVRTILGNKCSISALNYYSRRIVHTQLYEFLLENIFFAEKNISISFFTGNNLDRFALIEEKIAKKYNIKVICIPHGLEYGFKLPHCFIGDLFYTTSQNAAITLTDLYNSNKFVFDYDISVKMFSVEQQNEESNGGYSEHNIVFFTEPREPEVNYEIIETLLPLLDKMNLQMNIKLHPKDLKKNYSKYFDSINFIENYDFAISNNICFARKSTALIEATFNNSYVAAILISKKDRVIYDNFPSLRDSRIKVFDTINTLFDWIKETTQIIYDLNNKK